MLISVLVLFGDGALLLINNVLYVVLFVDGLVICAIAKVAFRQMWATAKMQDERGGSECRQRLQLLAACVD